MSLTMSEYQEEASKTAFYPNRSFNLEYPTLGLAGESGEVANLVKKVQRDDNGVLTKEKSEKIIEELGDVLWYVSQCCHELGIDLEDCAIANLEKLRERHLESDDLE